MQFRNVLVSLGITTSQGLVERLNTSVDDAKSWARASGIPFSLDSIDSLTAPPSPWEYISDVWQIFILAQWSNQMGSDALTKLEAALLTAVQAHDPQHPRLLGERGFL